MRKVKIIYIRPKEESFISNITNTAILLNALSKYTKVTDLAIDIKKFSFKELEGADYILADIKDFGPYQFVLRERCGLNIPFIIVLRTIYPWLSALSYIVPLLRKDDIIIAPSHYAKESFLRITDKFDVHVIPHSLDVERIRRIITKKGEKRLNPVITFMGRLERRKGINELIECMPEIRSKIRNAVLNVIGPLSGEGMSDSPESDFVSGLKVKVNELGLTDSIHFAGLKLGPEKYRLLAESDLFVLPTKATKEENFSVSALESLACGVPVITTDVGGSTELIKEGVNGYIINTAKKDNDITFDAEQMTGLIIKVLKDRRLNGRLKKRAAASAKRYDYRKMMPKLMRLLKKTHGGAYKNRWDMIKDKTPKDYGHLFNRSFLFFLHYGAYFENRSYGALYKRIHETVSDKKIGILKEDTLKYERLVGKLRRNLSDFVTLRS